MNGRQESTNHDNQKDNHQHKSSSSAGSASPPAPATVAVIHRRSNKMMVLVMMMIQHQQRQRWIRRRGEKRERATEIIPAGNSRQLNGREKERKGKMHRKRLHERNAGCLAGNDFKRGRLFHQSQV